MDQDGDVSTLYEWAGGAGAFERLTAIFYDVLKDPLLRPPFENIPKEHSRRVAMGDCRDIWRPKAYSGHFGKDAAHPHMMSRHLGSKERQPSRWLQLTINAADKAGLPTDPEFRLAFVAYFEGGTRIALIMSKPGEPVPGRVPDAKVVRWRGKASKAELILGHVWPH